MTVIHVFADGKLPRVTRGLRGRTYKNREFEAFNISWLPYDFTTNPNLCVFRGCGQPPICVEESMSHIEGEKPHAR
jgi:hypothetical protein